MAIFINDYVFIHFLFIFTFLRKDEKFMSKLESKFQSDLKKELEKRFPGCLITKLDPSNMQGIPDLLVLHNNKWATLENKRSAKEHKQPNQEYYVNKMNQMSFSRFIFPENKDEVLTELTDFFNE